jgi:hypothetical protein
VNTQGARWKLPWTAAHASTPRVCGIGPRRQLTAHRLCVHLACRAPVADAAQAEGVVAGHQAKAARRHLRLAHDLLVGWSVGWALQANARMIGISEHSRQSCCPVTLEPLWLTRLGKCSMAAKPGPTPRSGSTHLGQGSNPQKAGSTSTQGAGSTLTRSRHVPFPGRCRTLCCCPSHAWQAWPPGPHTRPGGPGPPGRCRGAARAAGTPAGRKGCGRRSTSRTEA